MRFAKLEAIGFGLAATLLILGVGVAFAQVSAIGGQPAASKFGTITTTGNATVGGALTVTGDADLNTIDSIAVSDFARLSTGGTFLAGVTSSSTSPRFCISDTDGGSGSTWLWHANGGAMSLKFNATCSITGATNVLSASETDINLTAATVRVNGVEVPKVIGGSFTGAGCSVTRSFNSPTCAHPGTGAYTIGISAAGFAQNPVCTCNTNTGSAGNATQAECGSPSTTSVSVVTLLDGSVSNQNFSLICIGS